MTVTTATLKAGDQVKLPGGIVRTVDRITPSPYVNYRGEPIVYVLYREPAEPGVWSEGNSAIAASVWDLAE